ncbi:MAG: PAS domain S-box protein [Magnetospirillum sp.]|nr:PAS domain S-box protein [Magnetospirillum sp.]
MSPPRTISTTNRLLPIILAPVLALIAFGAYVVEEKLSTYRHNADLLVGARMARIGHALAREVQTERSLSAQFVSGGRSDGGALDLERQRDVTDARLAEFRALVARPQTQAVLGRGRLDLGLGEVDALRAAVDGDADLKMVIERYSRLISTVLASSARLMGDELATQIAAYMDIGNIRDRLARAAALGESWLSGRRGNRDLVVLLTESHAEIHAFTESFRGHAPADQVRLLDVVMRGPLYAEIDRLHDRIAAGRLSAADIDAWRRTHEALGEQLALTEDRLAADMERRIESNLAAAKIAFFAVLAVVLALVAVAIETLRRSERRAARAEEEARKLFRAIEQSPVSVLITDPGGTIEYVNPAFTRMTGYLREEVLGRNPRILRSPETPRAVHAQLWRTIAAGHEWRSEIRNRHSDGHDYWESITVAPVKGADGTIVNYVAFKENVTEIKALRQALDREHANVRRILESLNDGIALIDDGGRFAYANPALLGQFGPISGRHCADYFGADGDCPVCNMHGDVTERREWHSEHTGRTYELTGTPVHTPEGATALLQVFHDITAHKQAEEATNAAREAAEMANRAKSEFLATMSHELRTPLNAIIGFSEIIESQLLGPVGQSSYVEYAHDIHDSGRHLLQLINDILDVARLEVGRVTLREELLDPSAVVKVAITMVRERADAAGLTLNSVLTPNLPGLWADERRSKQVLVNLLANAVKFTPAGGSVAVKVRADRDAGLDVVISDTGIGIAAEDVAKILAPFAQADSSMARRYQGSGLGLPLSVKLMELHGGTLAIDSHLGAGTTVTVHFPADRLRW